MTSLSKSAILIAVSTASFGRSRKDKKQSQQVLDAHGVADQKAARVIKDILPEEAYTEWDDWGDELDVFLKKNTSPFSKGLDLLPLKNFQHTMTGLRAFRPRFEAIVAKFGRDLPGHVAAWQGTVNGLFDPNDYPRTQAGDLDVAAICGRFKFSIEPMPVPDGQHYLLDMAQEHVDELKSLTDQAVAAAAERAQLEPYRRLAEMLVKIITRKRQFKELWTDVLSELDTLKRLTVCDDPAFDELRNLTESSVAHAFAPENLGKDEAARASAADAAKAILQKMEGYL